MDNPLSSLIGATLCERLKRLTIDKRFFSLQYFVSRLTFSVWSPATKQLVTKVTTLVQNLIRLFGFSLSRGRRRNNIVLGSGIFLKKKTNFRELFINNGRFHFLKKRYFHENLFWRQIKKVEWRLQFIDTGERGGYTTYSLAANKT